MSDLQKAGRYEIIGRIGEGGFGVVYKGRDPFMKRLVAIKTCTSENDETQKRFLREAEIAGNIEHPNVTVLYDFGYEDNVPYLVQEFLTGKDLDHRLHDGEPLTLPEKLDILLQMSQGLGFAHEQGITHRDIKPGNVRITDESRVKIMDFGIAKIASAESQLTQTGTTLGTPAYLSPEQLRGDPVDQRSDIYSFGVLAFELLTYRRMFEAETISALFFQILHQESPDVASVWTDCPKKLDDIIGRCVAKEPDDRYPSFREVILDLQPLIEHYEANPADLPNEQPVPAAKPEDQASIAEGQRQVAVTRARDQIEELLVSGDLKQAARALVTARRQHGDPLPLRTLHERLIQMQTQSGHLNATVEDTPATQTAAQRIDEYLFAGDLDQARAELREARQEIGDTPGLLAAEERVDAVVVAEQAADAVAQAREQIDAGALAEAESLLDQARNMAPDAEGLETAYRDLESRKVKARAGALAGEARQLMLDGNLGAALEKVDLASAEAGTDNELEQLRSEIEAAMADRESEDTVVPTAPELDPHEDATVMAKSPLADDPDLRNALPQGDVGDAPTQMVPGSELAGTEEATQFVPHVEQTQPAVPQVEATQPAIPQVEATQPAVPQVEATQPAMPAQPPEPTQQPVEPPKPSSFKPPAKAETGGSGLDPKVFVGAAAGLVALLLVVGIVWFATRGGGDVGPQTVTLHVVPWGEITSLESDDGSVVDLGGQRYTPLRLELAPGEYSATFVNGSAEPLEVTFEVGSGPVTESFDFAPVDIDTYFQEAGLSP